MPKLTKEESDRLEGPQRWTCAGCKQVPSRIYCNRCDEFYYVCGCHTAKSAGHDHHPGY